MRKLATLTPIILPLLLAAGAPLHAGTVVTIEDRDLPAGDPEVTTIQVEGTLVAMGSADGRMIFRGDRQEMLAIDDENKTYSVIDDAMLEGISGMMDAAMKQMEAQIKTLPPEQQEAARKMMKQQLPAAGAAATENAETVTRTSERATKEGYSCVKYEVRDADDNKVRELWVTDWSNVPGQADLSRAIRSVAGFVAKMMAHFSRFGASASEAQASIAQWTEIDGLPVVTIEFENGEPVSESVMRTIEQADVAASAFEPPTGYTLQKLGAPAP